jgi:hypothetical protein
VSRFRTALLTLLVAALAVLAPVAALAGTRTAATTATTPSVRLFTPTTHLVLTVHNSGADQWIDFNPAVYLEARGARFEIDVSRPDYRTPLSATFRFGDRVVPIPHSLLARWHGLKDAFTLIWTTPSGALLSRHAMTWCPNDGGASRLAPNAAPTTDFVYGCSTHPFTKSTRWGIDRGWARQVFGYEINPPANLPGNHLVFQMILRPALAAILGINDRVLRFDVTVAHVTDPVYPPLPAASGSGSTTPRLGAPSLGPSTDLQSPPLGTLPDLVALPSFGISTHVENGHDYLDFAATVYNAGRGPLVAEGFRRGGTYVMSAHQLFYRGTTLIGSVPVGTMMYDARPTHQHWHFEDFARYDLVNADHVRVRTSGKEAFCLAPTDAIDLLLPRAAVNPGDSNLATACGDVTSIWVREVLASGWGDTYTQARAGQSLDITGLPNGTYYIRITANPSGRLHEVTRSNDVSLRRVILGGVPGARTVRVPAYGLVDSEAGFSAVTPGPPIY